MANVQLVGSLEDIDGVLVCVYIEGDRVRLEVGSGAALLEQQEAEEFGQLFVSACWETGRQAPGG